MLKRSKCCIIGIPDHQGVIHVGGRVGAAGGPAAFRRVFSRFRWNSSVQKRIEDLGDLNSCTSDVVINHRLAANLVRDAQRKSGFTIIVGGGHDHGYSQLLGIAEALHSGSRKLKMGCLNIDAHLDVRKPAPYITSGSPYYLAIESKILHPSRFVEFGIQSHCNSSELWNYVESKKVRVIPFRELRGGKAVDAFRKNLKKLASQCDVLVVSLDLDAAAEAFAPGVSAPQAEGFSPMEIIEMMEIAGREKKVKSLGIFELNPEHDLNDRTARLAATAAYHFIESGLV